MSSYKQALKLYAADTVRGKPASSLKSAAAAGTKSKHTGKSANNNLLDHYYEIQRRENEAARVIQVFWKRSRRLIPWRRAVRAVFAVVLIQKMVRGWVARRFVAKWFTVKTFLVTRWQACVRKYLSNKHHRPVLANERAMAIRIQCCARKMLARRKCERVLRNLAATRIQALWRAVVDRSQADRLWLNKVVIPIQNAARRMVAMKKFGGQRKMLSQAALMIQRRFRTIRASQHIGSILHEREMGYRLKLIHMLTSEEEFYQQKITRQMNRVIKNDVKGKAAAALKALQLQEEMIAGKEGELVELRRQIEILSPRAIEQGFRGELQNTAVGIREAITELKCQHLFELTSTLHQAEETLESNVHEIEEYAACRARVSKYREQEYEDRRHLDYHRGQAQFRKSTKQAIAEEKRKWTVKFYTKSGKPDKRRRPGRPWDPSVFAGPEKNTYSGAVGVDLLAFAKQGNGQGKSTDVKKNVDAALGQVTLQTYLDQVNTYQTMLNPILLILQQHMGLAPGDPSKTGSQGMKGFGEEGQKFKEALQSLDVQPPPRTRIKTRGKKGFRTVAFPSSSSSQRGGPFPVSNMDKDMGFEPPSTAASSITHSRLGTATEPDIGVRRSTMSSRGATVREVLDDVSFQQVDADDDSVDVRESIPRKLFAKGSALENMDSSISLLASPGASIDTEADMSQLLPALEGILLPSTRYWKRPPKKYLPAENAFSIPIASRSVFAESAQLSKSVVIEPISPNRQHGSLSRVSSPKVSNESKLRLTLSASTSTNNLRAQVAAEQDRYMDLSAIVAEQQLQEEKEIAESRQRNREMRNLIAEKRKERKASTRRKISAIPWELLDEIDGAQTRLENEMSFVEFNKKF